MVQQNSDRLKGRGSLTLEPGYPERPVRWVARDAEGVVLGTVRTTGDPKVDEYAQALTFLGLKRPFELNKALVSIQARETWDDGDPWGSAIGLGGTLCDVAHVLGGKIDERAGYQSAMGLRTADDLDTSEDTGDSGARYLLADIKSGEVTLHDVELAITIISRYLDLPQVAAGRY